MQLKVDLLKNMPQPEGKKTFIQARVDSDVVADAKKALDALYPQGWTWAEFMTSCMKGIVEAQQKRPREKQG